MTIQLRPYQQDAIDRLRDSLRRHDRTCLQAPTGAGKTVMLAYMAAGAMHKGKRVTFVVHRQELWAQASRTFDEIGLPHGIIAPGQTQTRHPVQIASIQTLVRRLGKTPTPDLLVFDEAHHVAARTWQRLVEAWPGPKMVGLTATPCRLDGRGLDDVFEDLVRGPSVRALIDAGYLADYCLFAPPMQASLDGVKTAGGDYQRKAAAAAMDKPTVTGDAVAHYQRICPGKRAIVFAASVAHSKHVVASFRAAGVRAEHLDGTEDVHRRRRIVQAFARGEIQVLSNVDLFGEGFDVPGIDAAILLRPTQSLALYLQMVGRALRPAPGKDRALILDHAGNALRHGLPDDDREWTLKGRATRQRGGQDAAPPVTQCEVCFACYPPGRAACPACGHVAESGGRQIEQRDGELEQVDPAELRRQRAREQAQAQTFDELVELGKARGYRNPAAWARHVIHGRQRKGRQAA